MEAVLEVRSLATRLGRQPVHEDVGFSVGRGEIAALIGASGSGKSVLLKAVIGLIRPVAGRVELLGVDVWRARSLTALRRRLGVLFQDGALFSSLTTAENVAVPLREQTDLAPEMIAALAELKLALVGLPPEAGARMPAQLSGGMRKRAALARALALEPEVLFLDEPTSGLDPVAARAFARLLRVLRDSLGLTVFVATHDRDLVLAIADRVLVLARGHIIADGPVAQVLRHDDPWLRGYFAAPAQLPERD